MLAPSSIGWPGCRRPAITRIHLSFRSELLSAYHVHSSGRTRVQFCSERSGLQRLPIRPADGKSSHCRCSLPNCPIEALSWCWYLFVCRCPWPRAWHVSSANWLWPGDFVVEMPLNDFRRFGARWAFSCPRGLLGPLPAVGRSAVVTQPISGFHSCWMQRSPSR